LPDRVRGVVTVAGLAPFDADGLDWFAGMAASGVASLRAAASGRAAKLQHEESGVDYDPEFTERDLAALAGEWAWLLDVVRPAVAAGPGGLIDDDLAYVNPWGFDPAQVMAPALFVHGDSDRVVPSAHSRWLASRCAAGELRLAPADGHISVLNGAAAALQWLRNVV
jgi:pimeloyl-ACP methyl ester carboxylesterase